MLPMVRQAHHEDNSLKTLSLILRSKDEAKMSYFFSSLLILSKERRLNGLLRPRRSG
jgi:hypothetical protein